ncbi:MAG: aldehyde dehydrogenase family protein [Candidatus Zixiibacteriota bacterium]
MEKHPIIVGGERVIKKDAIDVRFPFNGDIVHQVVKGDREDVDNALFYADKSFKNTRTLSIKQRQDILRNLAVIVSDKSEDFAKTICIESGKTINEARGEVSRSLETIRLSILATEKVNGEVLPLSASPNGQGKWGFYERFPLGPAAFITPFNFPLNLVMHKVAPAIAVGCPFILKPASQTPLTSLMLGDAILEAGYPRRAVSVIAGSGSQIGILLVSAPEIKTVSFTGSPEVGEIIAKNAGMKPIALELGSNSAAIIDNGLEKSEMMRAASRITLGAFALAGQVCISTQRVYILQESFDTFLKYLKAFTNEIITGDPGEESTNMGSMISEEEAEKAYDIIHNSGGQIEQGGKFIEYENAWKSTIEPTIVINPPEDSSLIDSEAFAPVVSLKPVKTLEEAIHKVENTDYGLQTGIFTSDIHSAREAFDKITTGGVIVNDIPTFRADLMPYGGQKKSGMLREGPEFAIEHLTYPKSFVVHRREL